MTGYRKWDRKINEFMKELKIEPVIDYILGEPSRLNGMTTLLGAISNHHPRDIQ
jgi:hypothetical protein